MCVSRHHQPVCRGCICNYVGIGNYIRWWHDFPTQRHEMAIHHLAFQTNVLSRQTQWRSRLVCIAMLSCVYACHSGFDVDVVCCFESDGKTLWNLCQEHLDWDTSIEIWFCISNHFKMWLANITLYVFFAVQTFLKSLWTQSGYPKNRLGYTVFFVKMSAGIGLVFGCWIN